MSMNTTTSSNNNNNETENDDIVVLDKVMELYTKQRDSQSRCSSIACEEFYDYANDDEDNDDDANEDESDNDPVESAAYQQQHYSYVISGSVQRRSTELMVMALRC